MTSFRSDWTVSAEVLDAVRERLQANLDKPQTPSRLRKSTLKLMEQMACLKEQRQ